MTNPPIPQRFIAALAAAVHEARASLGHPGWDEPGIAAAIRQLDHVNLADLLITFGRAVADPTNETPAAVLHPTNRAWDNTGYPPCPNHPGYRARRTDGECGACYADRNADTSSRPTFHRQPDVDSLALAVVRDELAKARAIRRELAQPATREDVSP